MVTIAIINNKTGKQVQSSTCTEDMKFQYFELACANARLLNKQNGVQSFWAKVISQ